MRTLYLPLCSISVCAIPHGFSLWPPKATSFVFILCMGRLVMEPYTSFEKTLHSAPVSKLNETYHWGLVWLIILFSFCLSYRVRDIKICGILIRTFFINIVNRLFCCGLCATHFCVTHPTLVVFEFTFVTLGAHSQTLMFQMSSSTSATAYMCFEFEVDFQQSMVSILAVGLSLISYFIYLEATSLARHISRTEWGMILKLICCVFCHYERKNKEPRKETKADWHWGRGRDKSWEERTRSQERRQRQSVAESAGLSYQVTRFYEQNIIGKQCRDCE